MTLCDIVSHLNVLLRVGEIEDYPKAFNGLQLENAGEVTKVAAAVDACEAVLVKAIESGADLLIVHHGLFWNGFAPVTGPAYRKLKLAMENNLAIYSAHLPLDAHPSLGNNALLCTALDLAGERTPFLDVGLSVPAEISRAELLTRLHRVVGKKVHLAPGGPELCRKIGICSGGAGSEIFKAAASGVDTFITGEGSHWTYTAAEELGVNLFYAGHYETETFGVKALAWELETRFQVPHLFVDHPSGL